MKWILSLILVLVCAYGCYVLAPKSGHNKYVGLVLGLLFNILAVAIYWILSKVKK